ncbi:MAG: hypothetical protein WD468_11335 [Pirellulales bacterium]
MSEAHSMNELHWLRTWLPFVMLAIIHVGFQLFLNPLGAGVNVIGKWLGLVLMGVVVSQPIILGIWAALGPGGFFSRVSITLAVLVAVSFGGSIKRWNLWQPHRASSSISIDDNLWPAGFFLLVMGVLLLTRKFAGWQIVSATEEPDAGERNQFSVRFLLYLTTFCAVLLGIGRGMASTNASAMTFAGIMLLALFPVLVLPLLVLSVQPLRLRILLAPILWAALTWLATEAMAAIESVPRGDVEFQLVCLQVGVAIVSLTSAILVRIAGYRFCRATAGVVRASSVTST